MTSDRPNPSLLHHARPCDVCHSYHCRCTVGPTFHVLSNCGWCGEQINWQIQGNLHYDGVCVGSEPGRADRILDDYHKGGYGERSA